MNLSSSGVGLIRDNLADSKESCGFVQDLLIRENLADYENSADTKMSSSMGNDDDAGISRVIYPNECSSKVWAFRGAGRSISNESVI